MIHYRCILVSPSTGFVGSEEFPTVDDTAAVERVATLTRELGDRGLGFEVWQGNRLVHRQSPVDR